MRLTLVVVLGMLAVAAGPRSSWAATVEEVVSELMCPCPDNCNQQLSTCQCDHSDGYRAEVRKRLSSGQSKEQIVGWFVATYGEKALTTPPASGFGMAAWALPPVALAVGVVLLMYMMILRWRAGDGRSGRPAGSARASQARSATADKSYLDQVEDELRE